MRETSCSGAPFEGHRPRAHRLRGLFAGEVEQRRGHAVEPQGAHIDGDVGIAVQLAGSASGSPSQP